MSFGALQEIEIQQEPTMPGSGARRQSVDEGRISTPTANQFLVHHVHVPKEPSQLSSITA
jgi:hypothetical protein